MTGGDDGCTHYRIALPLWGLQNRGHDVMGWRPDIPPLAAAKADVIIGQRVWRTYVSAAWQMLATEMNKRLVFEIDDDLFHVHPSNARAYNMYSNHLVQARLARNAAVAKAVFVSTEPLAEVMRQHNDRVFVLPNCVVQRLIDETTYHCDDTFVVGWAGSGTHALDFGEIAGALHSFQRRHPAALFHTIGGNYLQGVGINKYKVKVTKWKTNVWDYYKSINFDVCVIPLANDVFNHCKSDIKFVEMAALGIPVIASDVGPYRASIVHGKTGFLASRRGDWSHYLNMLAADPGLRAEISANAKQWARTRTIESNTWRWEQALGEVMRS